MSDSWRKKSDLYLKTSKLYQLGGLPTEQPHPETRELSEWSLNDLNKGITQLQKVDVAALAKLTTLIEPLGQMRAVVRSTLEAGDRIFICGCGATGRLALTIESLWREMHPNNEQVQAFMAGGDIALVHSLEGFEDYPEYGARHLEELGFGPKDLLISSTEGGETPFVIGATERAAEISWRRPYYLFCNPKELLRREVERSARVLANPQIESLEIFVGPMALSGSTRMQASTVLELAIGLALFSESKNEIEESLREFKSFYESSDLQNLAEIVKCESEIYKKGGYLLYKTFDYAITVFTDTTERAPTFSLTSFAPVRPEGKKSASLCYVSLPQTDSALASWRGMLNREPHCLNWHDIDYETTAEYMSQFDFSREIEGERCKQLGADVQKEFLIRKEGSRLYLQLEEINTQLVLPTQGLLFEHIFLKMILNIHSTLVMGRLGRYRQNIMTWVRPSNGKLIDRATRYLVDLYNHQNETAITYEQANQILFQAIENLGSDESVIAKSLDLLKDRAVLERAT